MLEIRGVSKTYGSLRALDSVSVTAVPGEILAVLGENGAGKSTLMGVLSGFVLPDSGSVQLDGQELALGRPFEIKQMGIEMVHQHFMLVPAFTVAENLALYRLESLYPWSKFPAKRAATSGNRRVSQLIHPSSAREVGKFANREDGGKPSGPRSTIEPESDSSETLRRPNGPSYVSEGWSEPAEQAGERNPGTSPPSPLRRAEGPHYDSLQIANELGWQIDPNALARDLTVGAQQRVEILKALSGNAMVVILDEPTAVLSPNEVEDLFRILRKLKESGKIVILIAHKLKEVMQIADRVTVLRKGQKVGSDFVANLTEGKLAEWMVGGMPPLLSKPPAMAQNGLTASDLRVKGSLGQESVRGVSFTVGKGEILGIGGVDGNGQIELAEALAQVREFTGELRWESDSKDAARNPRASYLPPPRGRSVSLRTGREGETVPDPEGRIRKRHATYSVEATQTPTLGYIPQDRQTDGLALGMSVKDNFLIQGHNKIELSIGPFLINKRITKWAQALVQRFSIALTSLQDRAGSLSGGNQQKVVVARTLESGPELLIAVNPTRGLDIQATNYVHRELLDAKQSGAAVVLFTTDLDELGQLADRTLFMSSGRFAEGVDAAALVGGSS